MTRNYHRRGPQAGLTKTERMAEERFRINAFNLSYDGEAPFDIEDVVPEAWKTLEQDVDVAEKKVKITLLLDESVAKFYRAQGRGFHARISRILATYAQFRMARIRERDAWFAERQAAKERDADKAERRAQIAGRG